MKDPKIAENIERLTAEDLNRRVSRLMGPKGYKHPFARYVGVGYNTASNWFTGKTTIPHYVTRIVELLETLRANGLDLPDAIYED